MTRNLENRFSKNLRLLRSLTSMTADDIANIADMATSRIARLESVPDPANPTLDTALRIANALGLTEVEAGILICGSEDQIHEIGVRIRIEELEAELDALRNGGGS